jgi:putative glutamine amidotransferase
MVRPIVGVTGELEAARWGDWIREAVLSPVSYTRAVERAGGTPVVLPPVPADSIKALIAGLSGLVFTGGRDVDPALYEEERDEWTDLPDHRRDRFELALIRAAIEADLPFLAIGRGMQVLSVARGGTLIQHLPGKFGHDLHRADPAKLVPHEVRLSDGSQLGRLLGTTAAVPSAHHQGLNRIGGGLLAVAWTPSDQLVEAVELQGHRFGIGVQWHPEEGDDTRLIEALIAAASRPGAAQPGPAQPGGPAQPAPSRGQQPPSRSEAKPGKRQRAGSRLQRREVAAAKGLCGHFVCFSPPKSRITTGKRAEQHTKI